MQIGLMYSIGRITNRWELRTTSVSYRSSQCSSSIERAFRSTVICIPWRAMPPRIKQAGELETDPGTVHLLHLVLTWQMSFAEELIWWETMLNFGASSALSVAWHPGQRFSLCERQGPIATQCCGVTAFTVRNFAFKLWFILIERHQPEKYSHSALELSDPRRFRQSTSFISNWFWCLETW